MRMQPAAGRWGELVSKTVTNSTKRHHIYITDVRPELLPAVVQPEARPRLPQDRRNPHSWAWEERRLKPHIC